MPPKERRGRGRGVATLKTVELDVEEQSKGPAALSAEDSDGSSACSSIKKGQEDKRGGQWTISLEGRSETFGNGVEYFLAW